MKKVLRSKSDTHFYVERQSLDTIHENLRKLKHEKKDKIRKLTDNFKRGNSLKEEAEGRKSLQYNLGDSFHQHSNIELNHSCSLHVNDEKVEDNFKTSIKRILQFKYEFDRKYLERTVNERKFLVNVLLEIVLVNLRKFKDNHIKEIEITNVNDKNSSSPSKTNKNNCKFNKFEECSSIKEKFQNLENIFEILIKTSSEEIFKETKSLILNEFERTSMQIQNYLENRNKKITCNVFNWISQTGLYILSYINYNLDHYSLTINCLAERMNRVLIEFTQKDDMLHNSLRENNFPDKFNLYFISLNIVNRFIQMKKIFLKEFCTSDKSEFIFQNSSNEERVSQNIFSFNKFNSFGRYFFNNCLYLFEDFKFSKNDFHRSKTDVVIKIDKPNKNFKEILFKQQNFFVKRSHFCLYPNHSSLCKENLELFFKFYFTFKLANWNYLSIKNENLKNKTEICRICEKKFPFSEFVLHIYFCRDQRLYYKKILEINKDVIIPLENLKIFKKISLIDSENGDENKADNNDVLLKSIMENRTVGGILFTLIESISKEMRINFDEYEKKPKKLSRLISIIQVVLILIKAEKDTNCNKINCTSPGSSVDINGILTKIFQVLMKKLSAVENILTLKDSKERTKLINHSFNLKKQGSLYNSPMVNSESRLANNKSQLKIEIDDPFNRLDQQRGYLLTPSSQKGSPKKNQFQKLLNETKIKFRRSSICDSLIQLKSPNNYFMNRLSQNSSSIVSPNSMRGSFILNSPSERRGPFTPRVDKIAKILEECPQTIREGSPNKEDISPKLDNSSPRRLSAAAEEKRVKDLSKELKECINTKNSIQSPFKINVKEICNSDTSSTPISPYREEETSQMVSPVSLQGQFISPESRKYLKSSGFFHYKCDSSSEVNNPFASSHDNLITTSDCKNIDKQKSLFRNSNTNLENIENSENLTNYVHNTSNSVITSRSSVSSEFLDSQNLNTNLEENLSVNEKDVKVTHIDVFSNDDQDPKLIEILNLLEEIKISDDSVDDYLKEDANLTSETTSFIEDKPTISNQLKITDFQFIKEIGKGGYGSVGIYRKFTTGDIYAIKTVNIKRMIKRNVLGLLKKETLIFNEIYSDYVVKCFRMFSDETNFYYVMELMHGGNLLHLLNKYILKTETIQLIVAEVLLALKYLHSRNIIHRDLKPENIVISYEGHFKLTDFGISDMGLKHNKYAITNFDPEKNFDTESEYFMNPSTILGTEHYIAPEVINDEEISGQVDFWSLGVLIFELYTNKLPFNWSSANSNHENRFSETCKYIKDLKINWTPFEALSEMDFSNLPAAKDLISKFLVIDPTIRWGCWNFNQIQSHPFFHNFDWDNIKNICDPVVRQHVLHQIKSINEKCSQQVNQSNVNNEVDDLSPKKLNFYKENVNLNSERVDNLYLQCQDVIKNCFKKKTLTREMEDEFVDWMNELKN